MFLSRIYIRMQELEQKLKGINWIKNEKRARLVDTSKTVQIFITAKKLFANDLYSYSSYVFFPQGMLLENIVLILPQIKFEQKIIISWFDMWNSLTFASAAEVIIWVDPNR